jgi:hypothetical protein
MNPGVMSFPAQEIIRHVERGVILGAMCAILESRIRRSAFVGIMWSDES